MGNTQTTNIKTELQQLGVNNVQSFSENDRLLLIKKIINKTVMDNAKSLLNKKSFEYMNNVLVTDNKYFDIGKLIDFYKDKYKLINVDKTDEGYNQTKIEYVLQLFRFIELVLPDININDMIFNNLIINNNIQEFVNNSSCNPYIVFKQIINRNNKNPSVTTTEYELIIRIQSKKNIDEILNKYKQYLSIHLYETDSNKYKSILYKMIGQGQYLQSEIMYDISYNLGDNDNEKEYAIFSFLEYLINDCKHKYIFANLDVNLHDYTNVMKNISKTPKVDAHRNKILFEKHYDIISRITNVSAYHYEPHGSSSGFSYTKFKAEDFYNSINIKINNLIKLKYKNIYPITFHMKYATCPTGAQSLSSGPDIGYCSVFTAYWYEIFLKSLFNINKFDKLMYQKYGIMSYNKQLTKISTDKWLIYVDEAITNLKDTFIIKYDNTEYDLYELLEIFKYRFNDHYKKLSSLLKEYNINSETDYYDDMRYGIINKHNILNKITIEQFMNYYMSVLDDKYTQLSQTNKDDIDKLYEKYKLKHKIHANSIQEYIDYLMKRLTTTEYFSIFVNYAYSLYEKAYQNNYFTNAQKSKLNTISNTGKLYKYFIQTIHPSKKFIAPATPKTSILLSSQQELIYKKEKEDYQKELERLQQETIDYEKAIKDKTDVKQTAFYKRKMDENEKSLINITGAGIKPIGEYNLNQMMTGRDYENDEIEIPCKNDKVCKNVNPNLKCDSSIGMCDTDKTRIGENCNDHSDCYSEYCRKFPQYKQNPVTGKRVKSEIGLCHKPMEECDDDTNCAPNKYCKQTKSYDMVPKDPKKPGIDLIKREKTVGICHDK